MITIGPEYKKYVEFDPYGTGKVSPQGRHQENVQQSFMNILPYKFILHIKL